MKLKKIGILYIRKTLLICLIIFFCSLIALSVTSHDQTYDADRGGSHEKKDPGSNRYLGQTVTMHEDSKFQIRKSMFSIEEDKMLIIVEVEKLNRDSITQISIQEYVDNRVKIFNNSNCYLLNNSSMIAKLKNKLVCRRKINESDYSKQHEIKPLQNNNSLEGYIPRIEGEVTLIYSFEICPEGNSNNNNKIEFFAMTVVDPVEYPSSSLNAIYEIEPVSFEIKINPGLYQINTGDLHCTEYQIRYFSKLEQEKIISIEFEGAGLKEIKCNNRTFAGSEMITQSISVSKPLEIELYCEYSIESVYSIPMITIRDDQNQILFEETFDNINIIAKNRYPIELILSIFALIISAITGCFSAYELSGTNKVIKSNKRGTIDQVKKMDDINIALAELKNELRHTNNNLDRIRRRMPK